MAPVPDRPDHMKRTPDRWYLHGFSDEVKRCALAVRQQLKREMPSYASEDDYVIGELFAAYAILEHTWKPISATGSKERKMKLAEAMADISALLVELTGRVEDDLSGKWELERRKRWLPRA